MNSGALAKWARCSSMSCRDSPVATMPPLGAIAWLLDVPGAGLPVRGGGIDPSALDRFHVRASNSPSTSPDVD